MWDPPRLGIKLVSSALTGRFFTTEPPEKPPTKLLKQMIPENLKKRVLSSFGGEGNGNPLQYSCLENPMDGGACLATVHGITKSRTRLSDFTITITIAHLVIFITFVTLVTN